MALTRSRRRHGFRTLDLQALVSTGSSTSWRPSMAQAYPDLIGADRGFARVYNYAEDSHFASEMLARFEELVRHRPGALSIMTGGAEAAASTNITQFEADVRAMVARALALGIKVTLCTEPINRDTETHAAQPAYMDVVREIAGDTAGVVLFEVYNHFDALSEGELDTFYEIDGAHLNAAGQLEVLSLAQEVANAGAFKPF